jgi:hypothetical protein
MMGRATSGAVGVSAVVVGHGGTAALCNSIASLLTQTAPPAEIVVVDDPGIASRPLSWEGCTPGSFRVVPMSGTGLARACNDGIGGAASPLVVILPTGDALAPTYLEQASELLAARDDLSFVCCARYEIGRTIRRWKPPPYTVAAALARGECGHISTVMRRELWERLEGFDEALPDYADIDFWLRALERGDRGAILDQALVSHLTDTARGLDGSRRRVLEAKRMLIERHLDPSSPRGEDVFTMLLNRRRELDACADALDEERASLERGLAEAESDIQRAVRQLAEDAGRSLRWGSLTDADRGAGDVGESPVERELTLRALGDLGPDDRPRRTQTVGPGEVWRARGQASSDLLILSAALEREGAPAEAVAQCRSRLRPGGQLLVTTSSLAQGGDRLHGFTVSSLRELLCEAFPPASVRVAGYGNLQTTLAAVAWAPLDTLAPGALEYDDPGHPTIVAGSATLPGGPRLKSRRARPPHRPQAPARGRVLNAAVLAFGRIANLQPDTRGLCTPPALFAQQMELLAGHYRPIGLHELAEQLTAGELAPGAVAVTFDGGYFDVLATASPIVTELGIPVTAFVGATSSDRHREAWPDVLERILTGGEPLPERLMLSVNGLEVDLPTRTPAERLAALGELAALLTPLATDAISRAVDRVRIWSGIDPPVRDSHRLLSAEEIAELGRAPAHRIGLALTRQLLDGRGANAAPIARLREQLQDVAKAAVDAAAYPAGAGDLAMTELARGAGLRIGCTDEGEPVTADSDPMRLPRLRIRDESAETLKVRLEHLVLPTR